MRLAAEAWQAPLAERPARRSSLRSFPNGRHAPAAESTLYWPCTHVDDPCPRNPPPPKTHFAVFECPNSAPNFCRYRDLAKFLCPIRNLVPVISTFMRPGLSSLSAHCARLGGRRGGLTCSEVPLHSSLQPTINQSVYSYL